MLLSSLTKCLMSARIAVTLRIQNRCFWSVILKFSQHCFWNRCILMYCRFNSYLTFITKEKLRNMEKIVLALSDALTTNNLFIAIAELLLLLRCSHRYFLFHIQQVFIKNIYIIFIFKSSKVFICNECFRTRYAFFMFTF